MFSTLRILLNSWLLDLYVVSQQETVPVLHCAPVLLQVLLSRADRVGTALVPRFPLYYRPSLQSVRQGGKLFEFGEVKA